MWWIICLIIAIIVGFICRDNIGFWFTFFGTGFILLVLTMILLINLENGLKIYETYEEVQYDIQGLQDNISISQNTNGFFILGTGSINSEMVETMKYYFYKVNENGKSLQTLEPVLGTEIYIKETNDTKPCLIYKFSKKKSEGFFKFILGNKDPINLEAIIIVVPENTIKIEYNVDLK